MVDWPPDIATRNLWNLRLVIRERLQSVGFNFSLLLEVFFICIFGRERNNKERGEKGMCAYNVIVGDTLPHVLRHIFPSLNPSDDPLMELQWMSWLHFFTSRRMLTLLSTVFITYPLCLYRDISKLAKASAIALIALLVIVLVMAIEAPLVPNSIKGNEELRWNFISSGWVQSIGVISFGNFSPML